MPDHELARPRTEAEWTAYHDIRRVAIFERYRNPRRSPLGPVAPSLERLNASAAALAAGWSPDTTGDVSAAQLAAIRRDPAAFLAELTRQDGMFTQSSGRQAPRLPGAMFW